MPTAAEGGVRRCPVALRAHGHRSVLASCRRSGCPSSRTRRRCSAHRAPARRALPRARAQPPGTRARGRGAGGRASRCSRRRARRFSAEHQRVDRRHARAVRAGDRGAAGAGARVRLDRLPLPVRGRRSHRRWCGRWRSALHGAGLPGDLARRHHRPRHARPGARAARSSCSPTCRRSASRSTATTPSARRWPTASPRRSWASRVFDAQRGRHRRMPVRARRTGQRQPRRRWCGPSRAGRACRSDALERPSRLLALRGHATGRRMTAPARPASASWCRRTTTAGSSGDALRSILSQSFESTSRSSSSTTAPPTTRRRCWRSSPTRASRCIAPSGSASAGCARHRAPAIARARSSPGSTPTTSGARATSNGRWRCSTRSRSVAFSFTELRAHRARGGPARDPVRPQPRAAQLPTRPARAGGARVIEEDAFAALAPCAELPVLDPGDRCTARRPWKACGRSPAAWTAEDLYLQLQVYARGMPAAFIDEPLVEVRRHGTNSYTNSDQIREGVLARAAAGRARDCPHARAARHPASPHRHRVLRRG